MGQDNKLLKGMALGALVGAAASMFDRNTRETTVENLKQCSLKAIEAMKDPSKTVNDITSKVTDIRLKFEQATDELSGVFEKINDFKDLGGDKVEQLNDGNNNEK